MTKIRSNASPEIILIVVRKIYWQQWFFKLWNDDWRFECIKKR